MKGKEKEWRKKEKEENRREEDTERTKTDKERGKNAQQFGERKIEKGREKEELVKKSTHAGNKGKQRRGEKQLCMHRNHRSPRLWSGRVKEKDRTGQRGKCKGGKKADEEGKTKKEKG